MVVFLWKNIFILFNVFSMINQPKEMHNGERPDGIIKREDGENH